MKKIIKLLRNAIVALILIVLVTGGCGIYIQAADAATVYIQSEESPEPLQTGDTLVAGIGFESNPGINSMVLEVQYNSNELSYIGDSWSYNNGVSCFTTDMGDRIKVSMSSKDVLKNTGTVVTLSFTVKSVAEECDTVLSLSSQSNNVACSSTQTKCSRRIAGTSITGNKVIIVAPTAAPAITPAPNSEPTAVPTPAPTNAAGAAGDSQTTSINISNNTASSSPVADSEDVNDSEDEMITSESNAKKSATKNSSSKNTASSSSASKASNKNVSSDEDEIPKTGVFKWEYAFLIVGLLALLTGTVFVVKYIKTQKL